ncbi:hypothetical protein JCM8547_007655 [Rhodosporidiobolus lusitaniae]
MYPTATAAMSSASLDRSPSLSSNSSGSSSSTGTLPPITPALQSSSTFSSPSQGAGEFGTPVKATLSKGSRTPTNAGTNGRGSLWSAGHRTGGGTASFDAARSMWFTMESQNSSPVLPTSSSPWARPSSPVRPTSPFKRGDPSIPENGRGSPTPSANGSFAFPSSSSSSSSSPNPSAGRISTSPTRLNTKSFSCSTSPTRSFARPPLPIIPSDRPAPPTSPALSGKDRDRVLSSAIFSSRDRPSSPALGSTSPALGSTSPDPSATGLGYTASMRRAGGAGHKRAMTLPHLGANGLPLPAGVGGAVGGGMERTGSTPGGLSKLGELTIEEDVPGLPGRARLSRPAESSSPFAPSAVFNSSHAGLNRLSQAPPSSSVPQASTERGVPTRSKTTMTLLPSQMAKQIDRQRQDLVGYEYLCHLAEARDWLTTHITTRSDPSVPLWASDSITDFEQSLRNGYMLAHLARSLGGEACAGPIYNAPTLQFRHTVNINIFFQLLEEVGLPEIFRFETVDLYDAKNLPKVIYCIHALAIFMAKRGLTEGMQDLVGKVDFTDAEVGAAQKGLSDAGVRMPNFKGLAKALDKHEPAPETPEQRQERELLAAVPGTTALQAHARGALARRAYAAMVREQRLAERRRREAEEEAARFAAEEERRRLEEEELRRAEEERRRAEEEERRRRAEEEEARRRAEEEERRRLAEEGERRRLEEEEEERQHQAEVDAFAAVLPRFQAIARGALERRRFFDQIERLSAQHRSVVGFQAAARAALVRRQVGMKHVALEESHDGVVGFQAACRAYLAREKLLERIRLFRSAESFVVGVQAHVRGLLARQAYASKARDLRKNEVVKSVGGLQSLARAALARRRLKTQQQELGFVKPDVIGMQAQVRGFLGRMRFLAWRENVHSNEPTLVHLQAMLRGVLSRRRYYELHRHFHENLAAVVRMQAAIRSRRQGSQYRQLRMGTNVPVSTIKNFMRLLDDSEFDYRGELQVESLRKELVQAIRETQGLEDDVKDLDTKIALLVKNKITHEVARAQRSGAGHLAPLKRSSLLSAANDPFAGGALDRQTQNKLDLYQQLFWHLQTKPQYLARLFANTARLGISDKVQKAIEATTFVVFGYAQGQREEFLLLKLLQRSLQEELAYLPNVAAFITGRFTFIRLLMQYGRGVNQKQYLVGTLGEQVKSVMVRKELDLGTDPVAIYRNEINKEEMQTGLPSQRPKDVDYRQAVADRASNQIFIQHLLALRQSTLAFLQAICSSTRSMPFGLRYMAREVFRALRHKFPDQPESESLRVAGHIVYYRFLQPAIVAPETYGIVEGVVPPVSRHNLAEVSKLLMQISVGRIFANDAPYLTPLNEFIGTSSAAFTQWIYEVINVEDAETHFRADEYVDAAAARRPVIYISPNDIYSTHSVFAENIDVIAPEEDDPVRKIVVELGGVPSGSSAELSRARADEVALTLATRLSPQEDPNAGTKHLFNQAKRRVLAILKIHHGNDLEAVLTREVSQDDEDAWARIVEEEEMEERRRAHEQRRPVVPQLDDIRNMRFAQLKMATLSDIVQLRKLGLVSREDKYQAILNAIAHDIRSKHHRRVQRQNELQTMHATLTSLKDKKRYLDDQIKSYHVYIDQSMAGIQKKSKKRIVLPWSLQGAHQRQLEKEGKKYQFGSYKYSAQDLYNKGVLLSVDQQSPKMFDKISVTISSDDIGVFECKVKALGVVVEEVELRLEDLLEAQFAGRQTIKIGDAAKCSLNLLIALINRKFYA